MESADFRPDLDLDVVKLGVLAMCNCVPRWYRRKGRRPITEIADVFVRMLLEQEQP